MFVLGVSDRIGPGAAPLKGYRGTHRRRDARGKLVLDASFLGGADARKGRWRAAAAEAKGVLTEYFLTGPGRDALNVAYGTAASKPDATMVREV